MYSAYSHAITHTHTVRVACSMSPYCHLAFLRQHFSPDTFVRTQHWIFPPVFFFKKITSRNIFTTRPSSELNTTKQYEKLWELTSSVWPLTARPVLEGWGKQSEFLETFKHGNLIEFFGGGFEPEFAYTHPPSELHIPPFCRTITLPVFTSSFHPPVHLFMKFLLRISARIFGYYWRGREETGLSKNK